MASIQEYYESLGVTHIEGDCQVCDSLEVISEDKPTKIFMPYVLMLVAGSSLVGLLFVIIYLLVAFLPSLLNKIIGG